MKHSSLTEVIQAEDRPSKYLTAERRRPVLGELAFTTREAGPWTTVIGEVVAIHLPNGRIYDTILGCFRDEYSQ